MAAGDIARGCNPRREKNQMTAGEKDRMPRRVNRDGLGYDIRQMGAVRK